MQELDLVRVVVALCFFAYASVADWRTRRVRDPVWIVFGTIALILLLVDLMQRNAPTISLTLMLPIMFVFFDIFWNRGKVFKTKTGTLALILYILSFVWVAYVGLRILFGETVWTAVISGPFVAFVAIVIFEVFYILDVIKGGADAKAVICLAMMFPWYPDLISSLPLIQPHMYPGSVLAVFPFALSVLFVGALLSIAIPVYFLIKNAKSGGKISARSFVAFKLPIDQVERNFVWLTEWVEDGKIRFSSRKPRDTETLKADLVALRAMGLNEVWVTYKIPFIIPLTVGLIVVLIIGNPIFAFY